MAVGNIVVDTSVKGKAVITVEFAKTPVASTSGKRKHLAHTGGFTDIGGGMVMNLDILAPKGA